MRVLVAFLGGKVMLVLVLASPPPLVRLLLRSSVIMSRWSATPAALRRTMAGAFRSSSCLVASLAARLLGGGWWRLAFERFAQAMLADHGLERFFSNLFCGQIARGKAAESFSGILCFWDSHADTRDVSLGYMVEIVLLIPSVAFFIVVTDL